MKTVITRNRYNIIAILGWCGLALGLVAAVVQYINPTTPGFMSLCFGLIGGGITVTFTGPWRVVTKHDVTLQQLDK